MTSTREQPDLGLDLARSAQLPSERQVSAAMKRGICPGCRASCCGAIITAGI